jgi:phosphohistidine swiveling domain-containing protein
MRAASRRWVGTGPDLVGNGHRRNDMTLVGKGLVVSGSGCTGVGRVANEVQEVFALLKDPALSDTILLVESPSATAVVPLLSQVKGIVCSGGGMTSHLAIVSREFGLPCLMAADADLATLDGKGLTISAEGEIAVR